MSSGSTFSLGSRQTHNILLRPTHLETGHRLANGRPNAVLVCVGVNDLTAPVVRGALDHVLPCAVCAGVGDEPTPETVVALVGSHRLVAGDPQPGP